MLAQFAAAANFCQDWTLLADEIVVADEFVVAGESVVEIERPYRLGRLCVTSVAVDVHPTVSSNCDHPRPAPNAVKDFRRTI